MMVLALFLICLFLLSAALLYLSPQQPANDDSLAIKIDRLLPQTQCGACSYSGCLPYARAISTGKADINQCSPGGATTIRALANISGYEPKNLHPKHNLVKSEQVALINEEQCIGCVKCARVCPVDAIIGAAKQMHTIMTERCTGCELCIPPCPVDCITMESTRDSQKKWKWVKPGKAVIVSR